ncbi:unnamed protein product [Colias eurytheme]|nr:unnamed protein product [Colias eurytheme]
MEVETGCLIWAIISTILSALAMLFSWSLIFYLNYFVGHGGDPIGFAVLQVYNILFILVSCSITSSFVFSVILLVGVVKKKAKYLESYITYGILITVFMLAVFVAASLLSELGGPNGFVIYLVCSIGFIISLGLYYGLILHMVKVTSLKFNGNLAQQNSEAEKTNV